MGKMDTMAFRLYEVPRLPGLGNLVLVMLFWTLIFLLVWVLMFLIVTAILGCLDQTTENGNKSINDWKPKWVSKRGKVKEGGYNPGVKKFNPDKLGPLPSQVAAKPV